jgi:hypothetical protein
MRKLLFVASMLFLGMSSMQAQVAYEKAKFFDNFYRVEERIDLTN